MPACREEVFGRAETKTKALEVDGNGSKLTLAYKKHLYFFPGDLVELRTVFRLISAEQRSQAGA